MNPSPFDDMVSHITGLSGVAVGKKKDQGVVKALNDGGAPPPAGDTRDGTGDEVLDAALKVLTREEQIECVKKCADTMKLQEQLLFDKCRKVRTDMEERLKVDNETLFEKRLAEDNERLAQLEEEFAVLEEQHGLARGSCNCFALHAVTEEKTFRIKERPCTTMSVDLRLDKTLFPEGSCSSSMDINGDGRRDAYQVCRNGVCSVVSSNPVVVPDVASSSLKAISDGIAGYIEQDDGSMNPEYSNTDVSDDPDPDLTRRARGPYTRYTGRSGVPYMRPATRYAMPYIQPTKRPVRRVKYQYF